MIEDLAGPRYYKPGLTPEEAKLRQAYYTAYYQITQLKPQYKSFVAMKGYDIDPKFRNELIQKCFRPHSPPNIPSSSHKRNPRTRLTYVDLFPNILTKRGSRWNSTSELRP